MAGREELRAVPEASLHVTLVFLGSTAPERVPDLWDATVGSIPAGPAPVLAGKGLAALPRRRPRVFALGLADRDGRAGALQRAIATAIGPDEHRRWLAHVTLVRVRKGVRARHLAAEAPSLGPFAPPAVALMRSHPGSHYETLHRMALLRSPGAS